MFLSRYLQQLCSMQCMNISMLTRPCLMSTDLAMAMAAATLPSSRPRLYTVLQAALICLTSSAGRYPVYSSGKYCLYEGPTCMLLDTLIKSLFEPGCVPHLHIQISVLFSIFLHWRHREDLHRLTLPQTGLRLLQVQAGLQGGPQDAHHLLDGAGGVGDSPGVVDPAAQQSSADVDIVTLQSVRVLHSLGHQPSPWSQKAYFKARKSPPRRTYLVFFKGKKWF